LNESPAVTAVRMTMGHWIAQCVSVACELKIPDLVADGPRTADELAEACGAHPGAMLRLLRALASLEVLAQTADGKFEATPLSEQFRQDVPGLGPYARFVTGAESWRAWGELLEAVQTGRTAFELVYGMGMFDYGREHPVRGLIFNQAMISFSVTVADEIVEAYDFSPFHLIVDVGGGQGLLLAAILRRNRSAQGVLFDLPHVVDQATEVLDDAGVADRCERIGGDFFRGVPPGGDAYVMKSIIHDWDDKRAGTILRSCRQAMDEEARVLVVDRIIPERLEPTFVDQRATLMDLNMLALSGGRERTEEEFRDLFESADLRLEASLPTPSGLSVIEALPA